MSGVKEELGLLVGKYGHELISKTLKQLQERDYSFLTFALSSKEKPTQDLGLQGFASSVEAKTPSALEEQGTKQHKPVRTAKQTKKEEEKQEEEREAQEVNPSNDQLTKAVRIKIVKNHETPPLTEEQLARKPSNVPREVPMPPKGLGPKEIKRWQKEKEDELYKELVSEGIKPESLLTKENLESWVQTETLTYAAIARGRCGLPETQVSSVAKSLGIISRVSQIRAGLIAKD